MQVQKSARHHAHLLDCLNAFDEKRWSTGRFHSFPAGLPQLSSSQVARASPSKLSRLCRAAAERYPVKPGAIPQLFDKPEFFNKIAERSQIAGSSPDLLFFAFYFQPVSYFTPPQQLNHALHSIAFLIRFEAGF